MDKITMIASLPPIQSAVNLDGQEGNARVKLDIPQSELPQVIKLMLYRGQAFRITIEPFTVDSVSHSWSKGKKRTDGGVTWIST